MPGGGGRRNRHRGASNQKLRDLEFLEGLLEGALERLRDVLGRLGGNNLEVLGLLEDKAVPTSFCDRIVAILDEYEREEACRAPLDR